MQGNGTNLSTVKSCNVLCFLYVVFALFGDNNSDFMDYIWEDWKAILDTTRLKR